MDNTSNNTTPTADVQYGLQGTVRNLINKMTAEYEETYSKLTQNRQEEAFVQAESSVKSAQAGVKAALCGMIGAGLSVGTTLIGTGLGLAHIEGNAKDALEVQNDKIEHLSKQMPGEDREGGGFTDATASSKHKLERQIAEAKDARKTIQHEADTKRSTLTAINQGVGQLIDGGMKTMEATYQGTGQVLNVDTGIARELMSEQQQLGNSLMQALEQMRQVNPVVVAGAVRG